MTRILVIDDESSFGPLKSILAETRRDAALARANDPSSATKLFETGPANLVIAAVDRVPSTEWVPTILAMARLAPRTQIILVVPGDSHDVSPSARFHAIGRDLGLTFLAQAVSDHLSQNEGYTASLRDLEFDDIIWLVSGTGSDLAVHVRDSRFRGHLVCQAGRPVDAKFGETTGLEALAQIMAVPEASIVLHGAPSVIDETIDAEFDAVIDDLRKRAVEIVQERKDAEAARITDDDLDDFLGVSHLGNSHGNGGTPAMSLFDEAEIAELSQELDAADIPPEPTSLSSGTDRRRPSALSVELHPIRFAKPKTFALSLETLLEQCVTALDGIVGAVICSVADGTLIAGRYVAGGPEPEALARVCTDAVRAAGFGLDPAASEVPIREMIVYGGARNTIAIALPNMQVAIAVVQKRSMSPSRTRAFLRGQAPEITRILQGAA